MSSKSTFCFSALRWIVWIGVLLSFIQQGEGVCARPPPVAGGSFLPSEASYSELDNVTYTCNVGHTHTAGNLILTCDNAGNWTGTEPTCTINNCLPPSVESHTGITPMQATYNYNTTVTYSCGVGYETASGNTSRTCMANASWDGTALVCSIKTCTPPDEYPNTSITPVQATYSYTTTVTYSCDVGYEQASGNTTRICTADSTWDGIALVCSIKTCSQPDIESNSSISPAQSPYVCNTSVTYSCDVGYEQASGNTSRTCTANATWDGFALVCFIKTCTPPDEYPNTSITPVQATYSYTTTVTYSCDVGYEQASGNTTRICTADSTWDGIALVCSIKTCSQPDIESNSSISPAQSPYVYNTSVTYSCDVGYEQASGNTSRTCTANATWDGFALVCFIKTCTPPDEYPNTSITPVQATYSYTTTVTYSCDVGYEQASGNTTRICTADSTWDGIALVCSIKTCSQPEIESNSSISPAQSPYVYNTSVTYSCDVGYEQASGNTSRTCTANATWDGFALVCFIVTCVPENATLASITPLATAHDYNTVVTYTCDEPGYYLSSGSATRTCLASTAWTGTLPVCTLVECTPDVVANSNKSPDYAPVNYSTSVTYACITGYELTAGDLHRTCLATGSLNGTTPVCSIKKCTRDEVAFSTTSTTLYNYDTNVTYTCDVGYEHTHGNLTRTCLADKTWSGTTPVCTIKTCDPPEDITNGTKNLIQASYDYNTHVIYTCIAGYKIGSGNADRTCTAAKTWSGTVPTCIQVYCAAPAAVAYSSVSPIAASYVYATVITYVCNTGYELTSGTLTRTCQQNELFSGSATVCSIKKCNKIDVAFASANPDTATYNYNTDVTYTCKLSYNHTDGDLVRTCNSSALWSGTLPTCTVAACLPNPVSNCDLIPNNPIYEFDSQVTYDCTLGNYISAGDEVRTCQTTGLWNGTAPTCSLVRCDTPPTVNFSSGTPSPADNKHNFNTSTTYVCDLSYNHTDGNLSRTCQEDFTWTGTAPVCTVSACIQEDAVHMTTTPDKILHEFNDTIVYECDTGYNYSTGSLSRNCMDTGQWDGTLPSCVIITCAQPSIPPHSSVSPNTPESNYNTIITYTCDLGYNRTGGDETRRCNETGDWNDVEANCTLVTCKPPDTVAHASFAPDIAVYNYSEDVTYTCDVGYNRSLGDMLRSCDENAAWTGVTPVCSIVQCDAFLVDHSTVLPSQELHNYNTSVITTCIVGYNLTAGDAFRVCNETGTWGGVTPVCTIVTCAQPSIPPHSSLSPNIPESNYNTIITYTCDLGYNRTGGDETRRCNETGEWNDVEANCTLVTCKPPDTVAHASFAPDIAVYNYSEDVTYTCDVGYNRSLGDMLRSCDENAAWTGVTPVCSIVQCNAFLEDHSTVLPSQELHNYNTSVITTCVVGYNLTAGDAFRVCNETGTWGGVTPICTIVTCAQPSIPPHSSVSPNIPESNYNTIITYTCDLGYNRTGGDETRRCNETGEWNDVEANCTLVTCSSPESVAHSTYSPDIAVYNYSDEVAFTCDVGYYHDNGNLTRSCDENAMWTGVTPVCTIVKCAAFLEPHSTVFPSLSFHNFNTSVTSTCVLGYNLTGGDADRVCNESGVFNGIPPRCTIVECDPPPKVNHSSLDPILSPYVYQNVITYSCDIGYEQTSGNASRECTETSEWNGIAPNCTIIHCAPPADGEYNSYLPVQVEYEWQTEVEYTCDIGYNHSTGTPLRSCKHDKTWNGTTPVCIIVTCDKIDVEFMTFSPLTADTHDFNTTIEYACVVGYNHSYGDLFRTCNYTGIWTGNLPNCTIITCDPPDPISHTNYTPVQVEHNWNTDITYECVAEYHYISGSNMFTCNESGSFPPIDFNCSVMHTLTVSASEPAVTWMNTTANTATILFDFDSLCDVIVTASPDRLNVSYTISGNTITVFVEDLPDNSTTFDEYEVHLDPFHNNRTWPTVNKPVFYGEEILDFQGWLDNPVTVLVVGRTYSYKANVTQGTGIYLQWNFLDNVTKTSHDKLRFPTTKSTDYAFSQPGNYLVTANASNLISSGSAQIGVRVIYTINNITFDVNDELRNTTQNTHFELTFGSSTLVPLDDVEILIDFKNGTFENFTIHFSDNFSLLPISYIYDVVYDSQGFYNVTAKLTNAVGSTVLSKYIRVWDNITATALICIKSCDALITSTDELEMRFTPVPRSGFEYSIVYEHGHSVQSFNDSILYELNNLTTFKHNYTHTGVFVVDWIATNKEYNTSGTVTVIVQNEILGFQAWLNNSIHYLAVGQIYKFEANATQGTNVTLDWNMEPNITLSNTYMGEFTYGEFSYAFNSPGTYDVIVTAKNLVSSMNTTITVIVIYTINNINFKVDNLLANTTLAAVFNFKVLNSANLTMGDVMFEINFKHGSNETQNQTLDETIVLPAKYPFSHLFDVQGEYLVEGRVENILGFESYSINLRVWDTLLPLDLNFHNGPGKYITNTTTELIFSSEPNAGFLYSIEYGDGSTDASVGNSILYTGYNLTSFSHVYTSPAIYTITWTAANGAPEYNRSESFTVLIQNRVPNAGFSLEPFGKKYPWINLQDMDISVNITLNDTVPLPTNATCIFDPMDGTSSNPNLIYNDAFFSHDHRYVSEGVFNSTFNCSNEVSSHEYGYNIEVQRYDSSFLSVFFEQLVPLNVSDTVTMYYHINNGGFQLIPLKVRLEWNYGDGTTSRRRRELLNYDHTTYTHAYSERGDYTLEVTVYAEVTNTTSTLEYPFRLGIMYFEYSGIVAFINTTVIKYTMYGVEGTTTTYTLDFDDGTPNGVCNSADTSGCFVDHLCPNWGYKDVRVVASNGTFIEVDKVKITCDNPIPEDLTPDLPDTVAIPDGKITLYLRLKPTDLFLPMLFCELNMGDPIKRDTYTHNQTVTHASPFAFDFQYFALGKHTLTLHCSNLINETDMSAHIIVTNKDFLFLGLFDRTYSQFNSPMLISSMRDTEIFNRLIILADYTQKTHVNKWIVNITKPNTDEMNRHGFIFTIGMTEAKQYYVILKVSFIEEPNNAIFEPTYVLLIRPPLHAEIVGGTRRNVKRADAVVVDAASLSFDPAYLTINTDLSYIWSCHSYNAGTFEEAATKHSTLNGAQPCVNTTAAGQMLLNTNAAPQRPFYVATVVVSGSGAMSSNYTQIMTITSSSQLSVRCKINCLSKTAISSKMQLVSTIPNNCSAKFTWKLEIKSGNAYGNLNTSTYFEYGTDGRSLTIKADVLSPGTWYLVTLTIRLDGVLYGPAYHEFVTNRLPRNGICNIIPLTDNYDPFNATEYNATTQNFNITCSGWQDEGFSDSTFSSDQPLYYYFFLKYSSDNSQKQILYFDPGATSNVISFRAGDVTNGYKATVVIRITDVIGDYYNQTEDFVMKPLLTTSQMADLGTTAKQLTAIKAFIEQFDDELIKANTSYDYRTLSRKILGIASTYNALLLNTSSEITLTPEDLLSLGYKKSDSGDVISWSDYWKLIVEVVDTDAVDYLITTGDTYTAMLHHNIVTWPPSKRIHIVAIETLGRALNATLARTEYSNDTAAILAAESADILARNLAINVDDRIYPHTEQVHSAAVGVLDLIRNILAELQTVLTPNLPEDPSVDQMRLFLEYIRIFKTYEEIQSEPLSLQEQTFLAQKQLQKYFLQKSIKEKSSKRALPHVTFALRNLTYVMSTMTYIGQDEMNMENDFVYISTELKPAYYYINDPLVQRQRVALELHSLEEITPEQCNSSAINIRTVVFKNNPYFWGQFADRITSYVPVFDIEGAKLTASIITYRLENAVTPACRDETPTYDADDPNKMIYILFDRRHAADDLLIFVRPNASELVYQLYFNLNEKPSIEDNKFIYSTEMKKTETWTQADGYKLLIKSSEFSATGKIWIALRPLLENANDKLDLLTKPFCANVTSVNCLSWRQGDDGEYFWDKEQCEVSGRSTLVNTFCDCKNNGTSSALTVGTTFYVPPNKIDFDREVAASKELGSWPVICMVIATMIIYTVLLCWAWREDTKDQYKWAYSLLIDNDIADSYFYIIRVYTGLRTGAGTESKIAFVLVGEENDTGIRILDDNLHVGFERGSVRTFVMSSRRNLGDLICLRIWHDDCGGNDASWYLSKVTVMGLHDDKRYAFICDEWLDFDRGDTKVDRVLNACPISETFSLKEMLSYTFAENHIWISVFMRPMKSNFSRIQRISCLLGLVYLTMIVLTIVLESSDTNKSIQNVVIGPFRFSQEGFKSGMVSTTVATLVILLVSFFFRHADSAENPNNVNSILRKIYRVVNDRITFDNSYLGKALLPPAEDAIVYNYHFMPHFCVYVGWTILATAVSVATFLLVSFSEKWELVKSEEWMTSVLVAFFCSILIFEVIKVFIIVMFYLLMCRRAHEVPEPYIDIEQLTEITKHNSATLTIGPQYKSSLYTPQSPDKETLLSHKIKRIGDHQLLKIVYQLTVFSALLFIVYTISFESRDVRSYYLKDHVENMFQFQTEVTDMKSYTEWLNQRFVKTYFSGTYYGDENTDTDLRLFTEDLANVRVGPARLRQLRVNNEDCKGPLGVNMTCHNKFKDAKAETTNYCLDWKPQPCDVAEKSTFFTSSGWLYNSSQEVWGFTTIATYGMYGGGGYFMKLDVNKDVCVKMFEELVKYNWFDKQTRAVILEFTIYNGNSNLFAYSKFVAEFPEVGGVITYIDIQVFRLYLNYGPNGNYVLFLEFFFLLTVLAATVHICYQISTDAKSFFKSIWNLFDVTALVMSYTTISVFIYKIFIIEKTIELFHTDKNAYVGFENLAFYDFVVNTTHGLLVFILSIRVSRILGYSGKINEMAAVISNAASDLLGFLFIFGITYFTYVAFGTLLFRKETGKYRDLFQTYGTLTEAIIGKNRLTNILSNKPGFAEFYYFTFVLFVLLTLATMAAAILNFSISHVKAEQQKIAPSNIVEVIFDRIAKLFSVLGGSMSNKKETRQRKDSDSELHDIISDFRLFIKSVKSNKTIKTSDKYKVLPSETPR